MASQNPIAAVTEQDGLFDRVGKTLHPNEAGRGIARATQNFFGALDDGIDAAQGRAETIRLGAGEATLRWFVMPVVILR